jgi:hypothetical protein
MRDLCLIMAYSLEARKYNKINKISLPFGLHKKVIHILCYLMYFLNLMSNKFFPISRLLQEINSLSHAMRTFSSYKFSHLYQSDSSIIYYQWIEGRKFEGQ